MRPFLVCIHDATPAYARETRATLRDLATLLGSRLSFAVVPDWGGAWPLAAHRDYCRLLRESADELLLHGYFHRRRRGWGAVSSLAERSDEMNGLDRDETRHVIERGQRVFADVFGAPARGFLARRGSAGTWRVTLDVRARKIVYDSAGVESEVPMDEWVPVGVFAAAQAKQDELGAPLDVRLHRIRSGEQTITLTVSRKPVLAGIDPYHLLDWEEGEDDDNVEPVVIRRCGAPSRDARGDSRC